MNITETPNILRNKKKKQFGYKRDTAMQEHEIINMRQNSINQKHKKQKTTSPNMESKICGRQYQLWNLEKMMLVPLGHYVAIVETWSDAK